MDEQEERDLARGEALNRQISASLLRIEELLSKCSGDKSKLTAQELEEAEGLGEKLLPIWTEMLVLQRRYGWDGTKPS